MESGGESLGTSYLAVLHSHLDTPDVNQFNKAHVTKENSARSARMNRDEGAWVGWWVTQ